MADERSLGELFADLSRDLTSLIRDEIRLARAEVGAKATRVVRHVGMLVAGGVMALMGVVTLVAFVVLGLVAMGVPPWGAALLVGLGLAALGALTAARGLTALREEDLRLTATMETLKETAQWTRQAS